MMILVFLEKSKNGTKPKWCEMETRQKTKKSSRPILVIKGVRCCTIKHIAKELNKDSVYLRKRFKVIGIKPFAVRNATNYYEIKYLYSLKQAYEFFKNLSWKGER